MSMKKKKKQDEMTVDELIEKYGYNLGVMQKIQPVGGISFKDEKFIKVGDGYEAVIHIYEYPKTLSTHWLNNLMSIKNIVTIIDVSTENSDEVIRNINKSMQEQNSRFNSAHSATEAKDAQYRYQELQQLYEEISTFGEIVKLIKIRIFISGQTYAEVEKKAKEVMNTLAVNNFKSTIYLNENKAEWKSMFQTYGEQQKTEYKRVGQPIQSETLAIGNPFHFSCLSDPYGTYLGYTTSSGGSVIFDLFAITKRRLSYNALVFGKMGAGKSTALKKILLDRAVRGDYVRGFDVTGEFATLVEHLGGKIIAFDGSQGIINDLEVLQTAEKEEISYARHITKLATIYKFLSPQCDDYELAEYQKTCSELYEEWGMLDESAEQLHITGLPCDSYPIYSDLLNFINQKLEKLYADHDTGVKREKSILEMKRLTNIQLVISKLIQNYGYMVDGHTTIENLLDQQIVYFNIKNLSAMGDDIFDSRIYSALSLFWDNGIQIGSRMKDLYDNQKIAWEDIIRFLIIVDEAHHIVNTNKMMSVEQLIQYEREGRKFFIGLMMAFQSIRDVVPEGSDQRNVDKIKTLFELSQYKFVLQQDSNARDVLGRVFRNELTDYQLNRIPRLGKGQCVLAISGDRNIEFNIEISEDENKLFKGGA